MAIKEASLRSLPSVYTCSSALIPSPPETEGCVQPTDRITSFPLEAAPFWNLCTVLVPLRGEEISLSNWSSFSRGGIGKALGHLKLDWTKYFTGELPYLDR